MEVRPCYDSHSFSTSHYPVNKYPNDTKHNKSYELHIYFRTTFLYAPYPLSPKSPRISATNSGSDISGTSDRSSYDDTRVLWSDNDRNPTLSLCSSTASPSLKLNLSFNKCSVERSTPAGGIQGKTLPCVSGARRGESLISRRILPRRWQQ